MPTNKNPKRQVSQGGTGHTVRANVARIRKESSITAEQLVKTMAEFGYNMPRTAISEIENGGRRVSVDDLMALSVALNVNPSALLIPSYSDDEDASGEVTAVSAGTTGSDIWAWADGWQALPQHRTNAPEVDPDAEGMERGRQMAKRDSVEQGGEFLDMIRPNDEVHTVREFLAKVAVQVRSHQHGEWLSLWWHAGSTIPLSSRVAAWPEGGWSNMDDYLARMKNELSGIIDSSDARYVLDEVLKDRKSNGND